MKRIIFILAVSAVVGWWIGGIFSPLVAARALGAIMGLMVAIPAILIVIIPPRRQPQEPQESQERPTRYVVLDNQKSLPTEHAERLEVKE